MTDETQKSASQKPNGSPSEHRGNSRATIVQQLKIESTPATKVYKRHFEIISAHLYNMGVMVPIITSQDIASHLENQIDAYMAQAEEGLNKEISRLQGIMESNAIDTEPTYTNPEVIEVEITTPHAARFLRMISHLDRTCLLVDTIWLHGVFTNSQRNRALYNCQQRVARVGGRIRNLNNSVKRILDKGKQANLNDFVEAGHNASTDEEDDASDSTKTQQNSSDNDTAQDYKRDASSGDAAAA